MRRNDAIFRAKDVVGMDGLYDGNVMTWTYLCVLYSVVRDGIGKCKESFCSEGREGKGNSLMGLVQVFSENSKLRLTTTALVAYPAHVFLLISSAVH